MIDALVHGTLIHCRDDGDLLVGRIVGDNADVSVQFTAKRTRVKDTLRALPHGTPLSVSGGLTTRINHDKNGSPFVERTIHISAVMTAQPLSLLARIL